MAEQAGPMAGQEQAGVMATLTKAMLEQATREGDAAFWRWDSGKTKERNPYKRDDPRFHWWWSGWDDAQLIVWDLEEMADDAEMGDD